MDHWPFTYVRLLRGILDVFPEYRAECMLQEPMEAPQVGGLTWAGVVAGIVRDRVRFRALTRYVDGETKDEKTENEKTSNEGVERET